MLCFVPRSAAAQLPAIPAPTGYVNDSAGVIPAAIRAELTTLIKGVERRTGAEIAILTVPTTAPLDPADYAVLVFERWGIGKKGRDNGVLFLVAPRDRRMWITVGYGLEAILPDAKVTEIRESAIFPLFRRGRYAEGILEGTKLITALIEASESGPGSRASPLPTAPGTARQLSPGPAESGIGLSGALRLGLLLLLLVLGLEILWRPSSGWVLALERPASLVYVVALVAAMVAVAIPLAVPAYFVVLPALPVTRVFARWRRNPRTAHYDGGGNGGSYGWPGEFSSGGFGGFGGGATGGGGAGGAWGSDMDAGWDFD